VPVDPVSRRLWGIPVVLNQGLGAKTGLVITTDAVTVDHDGVVDVSWSDAGPMPSRTTSPRTSSGAVWRVASACR
jgi:hypothetical protein